MGKKSLEKQTPYCRAYALAVVDKGLWGMWGADTDADKLHDLSSLIKKALSRALFVWVRSAVNI